MRAIWLDSVCRGLPRSLFCMAMVDQPCSRTKYVTHGYMTDGDACTLHCRDRCGDLSQSDIPIRGLHNKFAQFRRLGYPRSRVGTSSLWHKPPRFSSFRNATLRTARWPADARRDDDPPVPPALVLDLHDRNPSDLASTRDMRSAAGCRSTSVSPSPIRTTRNRPVPRGGATDIVRTRPWMKRIAL